MKFTIATIAAVAALLPSANAHLRLFSPDPFKGPSGQNQFPLDPSGSDYPCATNNFQGASVATLTPGQQASIQIQGSAVHGGGSCQISLTYESTITKSTVFRVIKSFQGGCPIENGLENLPANPDTMLPPLAYTVPADAPAGKAVLAWTWFNKVGNREMYMRCAPVTVGGSNTDASAFNKRPEIFKANIGNGCTTPASKDIKFPNPGSEVVGAGEVDPVGSGCQAKGAAPAPGAPAPVTPTKPTSSSAVATQPSATVKPGKGGNGDTVSVQPVAPSPTANPTVPDDDDSTDSPVSSSPVSAAPSAKPTAKPSPPVVDTPKTGAPTPDTKPVDGAACISGKIYCKGANAFQICNFGVLVDMGAVSAGTQCVNGSIVRKRDIRFSGAHMRRRHTVAHKHRF